MSAAPSDIDPYGQVTVTCGTASFSTPRNRRLLDALEDNGIRPEVACRSGECGLCRVRVAEGTVHRAEEARPRLCDERFGYVHSCVSYPLTNVTLEV